MNTSSSAEQSASNGVAPERVATGEHTPLPWRIEGGEIFGAADIHLNGKLHSSTVSSRSFSDRVCLIAGSVELPGPAANAALIVRAVNSHSELVEACEAAMEEFNDRYDGAPDAGYQWMAELMLKMENALAKAEVAL